MIKVLLGLAVLAVVVFAGFNIALKQCNSDWCTFFPWQRITLSTSFDLCAKFFPVTESYPRTCRAGDRTFTEQVPTESTNIKVTSPRQGDTIVSPVTISGSARVFENVVSYRVVDSNGIVLASGVTTANSPDVGQFGDYSVAVTFTPPATPSGTVEVYQSSAKDGSEIDKVSIPVNFR